MNRALDIALLPVALAIQAWHRLVLCPLGRHDWQIVTPRASDWYQCEYCGKEKGK